MKISVVIATFNRRALLTRTLPPLLQQNLSPQLYEIIVVVDGSTDGTAEFLGSISHRGNLRVIEQPNRGQAAAINTGLKESRGELVLFLDDDILCGPDLVVEHINVPRTGNACMAFGPVLVAPEGPDPLALDWARTYCDDFFRAKVHEGSQKGWYGCMGSANSSLPRQVALSMGGLDDTFSRGNDVEFGFRLLKAGYTFVYQPTAVTHQIFNKTRRDIIDDAAGEGAAEVRLSRKFPELRTTSRLALLSSKPWWKRFIARVLATAPVSLAGFVTPFAWICDKLRAVPFFRRLALRLLQTQQNIAAYRSAVREAGSWKALQQEYGARLPILMYHSIGPLRPGFDRFLTIPAEMFEQHLRWLARSGFTPIHLADWIAYQREGKPLPTNPIVLTFDDAYRDTADFGFPLLKKYGFKGTLFVVTNHIGGTNVWDLPLGVSEQHLMTAKEILDWSANGIEIGSHSLSHPDLRECTADQIRDELTHSREHLELLLGTRVRVFAYPYGYLDNRAIEVARTAYDAALTCDLGINLLSTDPMRLRRAFVLPSFTLGQMFWSTRFGYNLLLTGRIQIGKRLKPILLRMGLKREDQSAKQ
jgi:peptidoglycan/xylan/chitin deacetylase (PgdA/CDA1 family)/glycosyltransferase involved in cell wall biosynthesis